jgi:hypothetical protein
LAFYYPVRLGARRQIDAATDQDPPRSAQRYEVWREGVGRVLFQYDEQPETQVFEQMLAAAPTNRFWLILGEPGAGKTTLLQTWFVRLAQRLAAPALGMTAPALVRLRTVPEETWKLGDLRLPDALWDVGRSETALLEEGVPEQYRPGRGRGFEPFWLLDGLDEIPFTLLEERFFQSLANLPGRKIASARTAVYESVRRTADRYKSREHEILGLAAAEQDEFIRRALVGEEGKAKDLSSSIQRNTQVRLLASNPLMLSLILEVTKADRADRIDLPASRAAFYRRAVEELWHRKLSTDRAALGLRKQRDEYLTGVAAEMCLDKLRLEYGANGPDLDRGLRKSGLIHVDDITNELGFVHLTFQEYYLAQSLAKKGLREALEKHWSDPRYEETLALLTSVAFENKRFQEIEEGIQWLVAWGEQTHQTDRSRLWELGRSPLRTAYHIISRSAVPLQDEGLAPLLALVLQRGIVKRSFLRKVAVSKDALVPPALLAELAHDPYSRVCEHVAENPNTPPVALAELGHDQDSSVRLHVASNANTSPEVLAELAREENWGIQLSVALNPNTPAEVKAKLSYVFAGSTLFMEDIDRARCIAASSPQSPPAMLAELAGDQNQAVRLAVAKNANAPPAALAELALDQDRHTRSAVAKNANTPGPALAELANQQDKEIRGRVAANANTPLSVLAKLARDQDLKVRAGVAVNANTPPEQLAELGRDPNSDVRVCVAANANTSPELLAELGRDPNSNVRARVARSANTPIAVLAQLARDEDWRYRQWRTRQTHDDALIGLWLAGQHESVRRGVAGNPNAPIAVLVEFAREQDEIMRAAVAGNSSAPPSILAELARDQNAKVRGAVARNPNVPAAVLAQLAHDQDIVIGLPSAENPNTLIEDL